MLTFTEEILLLLLDDKDGSFVPIPKVNLGCAIGGAVLMDLAFAYRIDTDPESACGQRPDTHRESHTRPHPGENRGARAADEHKDLDQGALR